MPGADQEEREAVRGRQGPRRHRANEYPPKGACSCVDRDGCAAPLLDMETGDCMKCGHPVLSAGS